MSATVATRDMFGNAQLPGVGLADQVMALAEAVDQTLAVAMTGQRVQGTNMHLVTGPLLVAGAYNFQASRARSHLDLQ